MMSFTFAIISALNAYLAAMPSNEDPSLQVSGAVISGIYSVVSAIKNQGELG